MNKNVGNILVTCLLVCILAAYWLFVSTFKTHIILHDYVLDTLTLPHTKHNNYLTIKMQQIRS